MTKLVRVIYFVGVPFAIFENDALVVLFSDLPQLLYHGAVIITGRCCHEPDTKIRHYVELNFGNS